LGLLITPLAVGDGSPEVLSEYITIGAKPASAGRQKGQPGVADGFGASIEQQGKIG